MPNERVSMSKLKQLIALQASNLSVRAMARALGLSIGAVSKYLRAVRTAGIGPEEAEALPESELEQRVFGPAPPGKPPKLVPPDYAWVHTELKRHRHVTLQLVSGCINAAEDARRRVFDPPFLNRGIRHRTGTADQQVAYPCAWRPIEP